MAIQKISIEQFLPLSEQYPVLDVRSPGEYQHAHIPGAFNLPLFSDDERKAVGTAYKQQNRETAIKIGLDYFGVKMRKMVEEAEALLEKRHQSNNDQRSSTNVLLVHCWRGGMRSAGVAWLLDLYGFKVYTLAGGYKAYRKWVLSQFEKEYPFRIIGGFTGSGKTRVLHELKSHGKRVIDLEALANHKGSAFGFMGVQPKQEMFENLLADQLAACSSQLESDRQTVTNDQRPTNSDQHSFAIFMEDESQRIGNLQIPMPLWHTMRKCPVLFLDIPFEERLHYITEEYGRLDKEHLVNSIIRIQKRLGGMETKNAINYLLEDNHLESFRILLTYYDKWYGKALHNRENLASILNKIPCKGVDTTINTQNLLKCHLVNIA